MVVKTNWKPFHESIVDAIKRAEDPVALAILGELIIATRIPQEHRVIQEAYLRRTEEIQGSDQSLATEVTASIRRQESEPTVWRGGH